MLERQQLGQLVGVLVDQLDEPHQHPGAALRIPCGPTLLGLDGRRHGGVDVGLAGHRHLRLHLAGARVENVSGAAGLAGGALPIDEVRNLSRHDYPCEC